MQSDGDCQVSDGRHVRFCQHRVRATVPQCRLTSAKHKAKDIALARRKSVHIRDNFLFNIKQ
jgi:hypothetical protein